MTDILLLTFVFLAAGVVAVPIASRLGLGSVLGYLIAGIAISPLLALAHVDVVSIQHFAEFGVVMMLFLVGLELEPKMLWAMRAKLLGLGGGQVALTAAAVMGVAMLMGISWSVALTIGLVLALSSTAIVLQTLAEKGLMKSDGGQSERMIEVYREMDQSSMLLAEHHDPDVPIHKNQAVLAKFNESRAEWEGELMTRIEAIMAEK